MNYEYELTKDIERFSSVLGTGEEILDKRMYKSIEDFSIENNSLYALNRKKREKNNIENEFENPGILIDNKKYIILQEKEIKLSDTQKSKIYLVINDDGSGAVNSYLYYKNKKSKDFLMKIEIHTVGVPYNVILKDLNKDSQEEVIVENLEEGIMSSLDRLFVFKITEKGIEKN